VIRVLVVEDEPPILRAMVNALKNTGSGFTDIFKAPNGKKAMEVLQKEKIDVVFTDIRMPVMDGLELSKFVYEHYPHVLVVITSGYSDFEYARTAISYHVFDYLLKPVSKEKMKEVTDKLEKEIAKRRSALAHDIIVKGKYVDDALSDSNCFLYIICAGALSLYDNDPMVPGAAFWNNVHMEEMMESILNTGEIFLTFPGKTVSERVVVVESANLDRAEVIAQKMFETLKSDITITIVWRSNTSLSQIGTEMHQIRDVLLRRIMLGKSQIICCNSVVESQPLQFYTQEQMQQICDWMMKNRTDEVTAFIAEKLREMESCGATQEDITGFLDMITNRIYFISQHSAKKPAVVKKEVYTAIANFTTFENLARDFVSVVQNMITPTRQEDYPKLIVEIQEFLHQNYMKNITNAVLSQKFGLVASYISRLFKKSTGLSPGEYLTKVRIDRAKSLMLSNPDLMVKEIAGMVGFKDAYYFSKTFKKETGMWPTEFLKNQH